MEEMGRIRLYLSRQPIVVVERGTSMKNFSERPLGVFYSSYILRIDNRIYTIYVILCSCDTRNSGFS